MAANEWEWLRVDANGCEWMGWLRRDANDCEWMEMAATGMDVNGCEETRMDENRCEWLLNLRLVFFPLVKSKVR